MLVETAVGKEDTVGAAVVGWDMLLQEPFKVLLGTILLGDSHFLPLACGQ